MIRNTGWDDYMMVFAAILSLVGMVIVILEVQYGGGRHRQYIDPSVFSKGMYLNFLTQPIYLFISMFVKESVGFFLLRITGAGKYKILIMSIMTILAVYTVGCFFTLVLQCQDLRILWNPSVKTACWDLHTLQSLSYTNSVVNISTDFAFAILIPIPIIWNLQMNKRKKTSLVVILGMGVFACSAGIIRTVYINNYGKQGDFLWDSRNITIWYVIETQIGIIAGNLPCSKPLFTRFIGSSYGSWSRSRGYSGGTSQKYGQSHRSYKGSTQLGSHMARGDEIDLTHFGGKGVESDTIAIVKGGGSVGGESSSRLSDESVSQLDREIGGTGSISVPQSGIVRTTKVRVEFDDRDILP
ncbi:putative integral membrane family protein [Neofusicoccum parvum]|uniref:Integral membrane family protein n=1 Tax=Neofusicoccum parvum TaxID=310453 RepID=A0ACB5SA31_9PEZI|nr:putative integral membrane family protein [Neofusicoccum parvum]